VVRWTDAEGEPSGEHDHAGRAGVAA
jgi:hypothetical protein